MTSIQIMKFDDECQYRVWQYNEKTHTIKVNYMTLEEVLFLLSTKEE